MSKIDKLSILGIRSFDNTRSETIQFFSPLTLIVGSNGSGKTTIIECLKYATTGDHPPGTKGGAFIHDPKLCGEREVLAQVKLSFKSTSGASMVATRSLQLTVKKAARAMKTLEGQLLMRKDGERIAVSTRVAELDQLMPQYLGVSKAILDNVVFCHQDESLWPMSEPAHLKKKFDEIFEAQKYTKAIDNIKILRKKQNEELGKLRIIEEQEKTNKDRAEKAERRSRDLSAEIETMREDWNKLDEQLKVAARKAEEAWERASQFDRIIVKLDGKRTEARVKEESIKDAKHDLEEMSESDNALQKMLDQQDERARTYQRDIRQKSSAYEDVMNRTREMQNELGRKQRDHGKFQAEHSQYERQVEQRSSLVKDTAARHNIRGFDYGLDDNRIREFIGKLSSMAREQEKTRKRAHDESQKGVGDAQIALSRLNEEKSALNSSKENAKTQSTNLDRKIQAQQSNLNKIDIDEGAQTRFESSISDTRTTLQGLKAKAEKANWPKQVSDAESSLRDLETKREELEGEVLSATKRANETAEIDHLRKSLRSTEESLASMKGAHGRDIADILGPSWQNDLDSNYEDLLQQKTKDLNEAVAKKDQTQREWDQVDFKVRTLKDNIKKNSEESKRCESKLTDVIGEEDPREFRNIVEEQESSRNELMSDTQITEYYAQCRQYFDARNACKLCGRGFHSKEESKSLVEKFKKFLDKESKERESELKTVQETLKSLRELTPAYEIWARLTDTEIPSMEKDCQALEIDLGRLAEKLEQEHDRNISECTDNKYEVEKMKKNVQSIVKYGNDIGSLRQQIEELSGKQSQSGLARSLDEITEQQKTINEQTKTSRTELNRLRGERESSQDRINQLELEVRDSQAKLNQAASQLKEKQTVQSQIDDLIASRTEQRESVDQNDKCLQSLAPKIKSAQEKYDDLQRQAEERQSELSAEASKTQNSLNQLQSAQNDITAYLDRHGPQQLQKAEREIANIKNEQSKIEEETKKVTVEINKLKQEETRHNEVIKGIQRNLKYRKDVRSLESLRTEIGELEANNAEKDRDHHNREAGKWQSERNKLSAQQSSITGQMKSKDVQLNELLQDFNTEYRDAPLKHREAKVKVVATKGVVDDLGRYGGALDKAIMRYHSLKMDEINTLIEELWQKTYKGTDVDSILIRSDNDGGKGNKSYNYRVCMIKQDAEMDMRGRCSAGQKVLASIIIRLALAECFGVSCGLIALDEPTTNLDHDNIMSLAQSLHDIIKHRKAQSNFQLIVITHDEEFLRGMNCSDFCDHYFRVSRNSKQKSEVALQSIGEVSAKVPTV